MKRDVSDVASLERFLDGLHAAAEEFSVRSGVPVGVVGVAGGGPQRIFGDDGALVSKCCSGCKERKLAVAFSAHRSNSDGKGSECRVCAAKRARDWPRGVRKNPRAMEPRERLNNVVPFKNVAALWPVPDVKGVLL